MSPCLFPDETEFHLWSIKDAKDGDVLVADDNNAMPSICIFSNFSGLHDKYVTFLCYCGVQGLERNLDVKGYHDDSANYVPATKEQCEFLFQKIKESGYEWDSEHKQLKKIEQCPTDKFESKFKVGDWLQYRSAKPFLVKEITKQGYVNGDSCLPFNWENEIHLWSIKDAKDGDVLKEDSCTFIIERMKPNGSAIIHCCLFDDGDFGLGSTLGFVIDSTYPATKEQRDLLFQKMKEAGYEWDAEKKELKKIEQGSTDKFEPKFKVGDTMRTLQESSNGITNGLPVVVSIDDKYYHCNNELIAIEDQDNYEYPPMNRRKYLISTDELAQAKKDAYNLALDKIEYHSDEPTFDDGWSAAVEYMMNKTLQSLNHPWKPSEEQLDILNSILKYGHISQNSYKQLESLFNDLKKLKD